jgi:hypothetical protein
MKLFLLFLSFFSSLTRLSAQYENANLLAQSQDGKTVKLVWFLKRWEKDITGFDIKRRDGIKDWVKLNSEPILPEINYSKRLSVVETDETEQSAAKAKLYKLLESKKVVETEYDSLLLQLNADNKTLQDLMALAAGDYDMALMTGFAYVDHSVTKKQDYVYGVFINGTNTLLDSVIWNYGQIPDLNAVKEITSKADKKVKGIHIIWTGDIDKMRGADVVGFNIYREGIRLNSSPITASNNKDIPEVTWFDSLANNGLMNHYSISAESLFGIEGIIKSYTYNPADHPDFYDKPEVKEVTPLGYYFKEGINVKWAFPKEAERFIKGFYLEKNNMPGGYSLVSPLLDPSSRTFTDKSPSLVTGYISFKITALYNDRTAVPGIERVYNYFPMREPPQPQNVQARGVAKGNTFTINLSWDAPMSGDSITDYYRVYASDGRIGKPEPISENPVTSRNYSYVINKGVASVYKFCISAIGKNKTEGPLSDTVSVSVPSMELPAPVISKIMLDNNRAIIKWQYPEITDVKGFRLFQDKNMIATESALNKNKREFITAQLSEGSSYEFTIVAISANDLLSEVSQPASILVPPPHKK